MFAKLELTEKIRLSETGNAEPWLADKKTEPKQNPTEPDPDDENLEDELEGDDDDLDDELDDDLDDDEDDLDDDVDDDGDEDLDDLDDELDDDLIELDDEYDKGEEEDKRHPDHPRKYDD
jgi:ribonuclease E